MPHVHSSAVIDPRAQLAEDVFIGPGAVIVGDVVLGPGCRVEAHAILTGRVMCGARNTFGYGAVIGAPPQDLGWTPDIESTVVIGDDNVFREYVTIHRGSKDGSTTTVGDGNYLMCGAHLGHDVRLGNKIVIANNCLLAGHVQVGDGAFLGGGSVVHQYVRIGRLAILQGMSGVGMDVPPFTTAAEINRVAGLNTIGMRRAGFSSEQRHGVKRAFDHLYRSRWNISQALERAKAIPDWTAEAREFFEFVAAAKKRGVCPGPRAKSLARTDGGADM